MGTGWIAAAMPIAVLIATWWLTGRVRLWLERRAILDRPVARSVHSAPVPRGGGVALVPVMLAAWLALALLGHAPSGTVGIVAGAAALALLSWLDDLRGLPIGVRLIGQAVAVIAGLDFLPPGAVFQGLLPPFLDRAAVAVVWLWFVNVYNFMDGIDGITGIETAALGFGTPLAAAFAGLPDDGSAVLALSLAAGGLAFLRWNWHPAKIFLGDVGSVPLGYMLGWLLLGLAAQGLWAPALILPLYYLADAALTMAGRMLRRERFWESHRQHFYQRALAPDGDHAAVARWVMLADVALIALAVFAVVRPWLALALAAAVVLVLLLLLERRARRAPGR